MARTLVFFLIFWIGLFLSIIFLVPYYILDLLQIKEIKRKYVHSLTSGWSRFTLFTAGIKVRVNGKENIPVHKSGYVVICNHESNFDIPVLMATLPFTPAFVAKAELMRFPFIRSWMKAMECLPIDRDNPRESRRKIIRRIKNKGMNQIVLFPEGTRNRGKNMKEFKTGSLKLIFHNQLEILPVSINGTHKAFEERNNIHPAEVLLSFHHVIFTSDYQPKDFQLFFNDLQKAISSGLNEDIKKNI
jgi:1-acyl-sn-glycerol-3-phosphate acyltransferase